MLSFGPYKFTPTSLKYSKENRWSAIECIGKMPSLQNVGQSAENIDLEGIIYLNNSNKLDQLKSMKKAERDQTAHTLVDSSGNVSGQFVITRFEEKQTHFLPNGLPKKLNLI